MKHAHETTIAPIANGVLVKAGCKVLFAEVQDIPLLAEYFGGTLPEKFKPWVSDNEAFRNNNAGPEECEDMEEAEDHMSRPSFLDSEGVLQVHRISNGYVVELTGASMCYGVMTDRQLPIVVLEGIISKAIVAQAETKAKGKK